MNILTPFQKQLLKTIGNSALAPSFYLTGGTALAAFYLQHRFSEDLDFFSADPNAVRLVAPELERIAVQLNAQVEFSRTFNTFVECFITAPDQERVKLDFAQDTPYRLRPLENNPIFGIQVDSALDIAANKLAALFDRAAEKDFVDIYFVHQELITFAELLPLAREKQVGMDDYWLAIAFQRVRQVELLPRMIKPVALPDLQTFFLDLARERMDAAANPPD